MTKSFETDKSLEAMEREIRLDGDERPLWEMVDAIMRHVPEEVLNNLPADGAEQHDHYLYGSPKKAPRTS
ncbi:MAG TPA: hypothetical protein VEX60_16625 [Pyrinomonadaceae bacterium]|nr:hypothetical protein [Pyrinomonadaceae bacterium]